MGVGRTARTAAACACLGLALGGAPASAMQWQARSVLIKDPNLQATGFYRIPWRGGRFLSNERLGLKALDYQPQPINTFVQVSSSWVIVPRCGENPEPRGRVELTTASPNPLPVRCP